ncbi:MAG: tryptophan synthase subunit alpha [bacterium]
MSLIDKKFKPNQGTLAIGTVPGYPDMETSFEIVKAIVSGGADILEMSSSFSDPIADGPTLQQAHAQILKHGVTKAQVFNFYKKIKKNYPEIPIFVIEYSNIVYTNGIDNYYKKLKEGGVDLLLIPDVPLEELKPYSAAAKTYGIGQSYIAAPTTDNERLKKIIPNVNGFIYVATVTGITGARKNVEDETKKLLRRIKTQTKIPLVAGFGISKPEHVKTALKSGADGVVICSQIINIINKNLKNKKKMLSEVEGFVKEMKKACSHY